MKINMIHSIRAKKARLLLLMVTILLLSSNRILGEGTKQFMPSSTDRLYITMPVYAAVAEERINVYMNAGEKLYLGMRKNDGTTSNFRVYNPDGTILRAASAIPTSGTGYIASYNEAVYGPEGVWLNGVQTSNADGYTPIIVTATQTGNHYIAVSTSLDLRYFDATVTDASGNVVTNPGEPNKPAGRLWSYKWNMTTTSYTQYPLNTEFYIFTSDEFVNKIKYSMYPYVFSFSVNSYGVVNTAGLNPIEKAQSRNSSYSNIGEYRIFLNDPDHVVFVGTKLPPPTVKVWLEGTMIYDYDYNRTPQILNIAPGSINLEKNAVGCTEPSIATFKIQSNISGFTTILLDLSNDGIYTTDGNDRALWVNIKEGVNYVNWDFKKDNGDVAGDGSFSASATFLGRGPAHFPVYDVEALSGIETSSIRPFNKLGPTIYWDDSQIYSSGEWGDNNGSMNETSISQLKINAGVPRIWTYYGANGLWDNGNNNTMNSWFNAIDLGLPSIPFTVSTSATKCTNGAAPLIGDIYKSGAINTNITFTQSDFTSKFFDPNKISLNSVKIATLPTNGTLKLSGVNITANQVIPLANLGNITFTPNAGWNGESTFLYNATNGTYYASANETVYLKVNTNPTISAIANQQICTNTSLVDLPFTVGDAETPVENLNVVAYSHNTLIVDNSGISVSGTGANRKLNITPKTDASGTAIIYVKVNDGITETINSFSLYIGPSISIQGDTTVCAGVNLDLLAEELGATYSWEFNGTTLSTSRNLVVASMNASKTGTYTLTVSKDGCTQSNNFTVSISPLTSFAGDPFACEGQTITLSATETVATTYTWKKGTTTVGSSKVLTLSGVTSANSGNDYTLLVTKEGCTNTSDPFEISVLSEPTKSLSINGSNVNIGENGTITILSSQNGVLYKAFIGSTQVGTATGDGNNLNISINSTFLSTGDNSITFNADNGNCIVNLTNSAIINVNDAPTAISDNYSLNEGATININAASGVLSNDSDTEGNTLSAILISDVTNGTLSLNSDGSFTYTHNGSETILDQFSYKVNDGKMDGNTVTVSITVNPANDAPVAVADSYSVNEGETLNIAAAGVLDNDSDAEGSSLNAILVSSTTNGSLTLNANGSFSYTHN
ncbi:MAG: tandem-95 repeat protein, partial [Bacteroidales bacterium]